MEGGGRRLERGKVKGSFFQVGGQRAEADEKGSFYFPFETPETFFEILHDLKNFTQTLHFSNFLQVLGKKLFYHLKI